MTSETIWHDSPKGNFGNQLAHDSIFELTETAEGGGSPDSGAVCLIASDTLESPGS